MRGGNDLWIEPACALAECPCPDVIAIPDLAVAPEEDIGGRYGVESQWLRECYAAGTTLATACSGALMLAEAGLLDAGVGQRLVLGGGGTSWHDVTLFLIARFLGVEEAMKTARVHLLNWHDIGQQPFAALNRNRQLEDAVIQKCQKWIAEHYNEDSPVATMVRLSGLPDRSFKRRFTKATGMSPMEYGVCPHAAARRIEAST